MSWSATLPLSVGAKAPESLSLLQQRLLLAEEEAEALIRDMGALGVSRDQIFSSTEITDTTQRPLSPHVRGDESMLPQECGSFVSRMCRIENLLQTLKLTIFRMETEREMDPSHTADLKQQLVVLQQESEEEQQAWRREVMKLRDLLQQACQERDEARTEVQRLCETVEAATAAKMDVALAAEELKIVKLEISRKLMETKEMMRQESTTSAEAMKSCSELLQHIKEMEKVVEIERRQGLLLQSDRQVLRMEVQTSHQQLEEEKERSRQLQEHCQRFKDQLVIKDYLVSELKEELKRHQAENREIKAASGRVQADRNQVLKQLQEQDLLLTAARRNIHSELQEVQTHNVFLEKELERLKGEQTQLLQSSSVAQETADTQRELHEQIIERLQGELNTAQKREEAMRKHLEDSKNELRLAFTKLEGEKSHMETQLSKAMREVESLSSALQSQQDENRRLMGKVATPEHQQLSELEVLQGVCGAAGGVASQILENILTSHTGLQPKEPTQDLGWREQELASLRKDRLQAQREIRKHQVEVEKLQQLLTSSHWKNNRALETLQTARVDNKRLAQSLEQVRDQYHATVTLRDKELHKARSKISHLFKELDAVKQQSREHLECSMKALYREISELKMTVKDSSTVSNQKLRHRVSELERLVSKQKACIREQRNQLRQQQKSRGLQDNSHKAEMVEDEKEQAEFKIHEIRLNSKQVLSKREAEMERWSSTIQRWEAKRAGSHH